MFILTRLYLDFLCPSDGTLNGAPCQGYTLKNLIGTHKTLPQDFDEEDARDDHCSG